MRDKSQPATITIILTFASITMIRNILETTGTRILNALINLVILILLTREIGSEGFGIITIILIDITIIQLLVDLIAGSALIYFSSRTDIIKLLIPSYLWIFIIISTTWGIFAAMTNYFPVLYSLIVPIKFETDIILLALLNATMLTHYNLLLGKKRIGVYNIIFTVQILTLLITLVYRIFILNDPSVESWIISLYFAFGVSVILSFIVIIQKLKAYNLKGSYSIIKQVFRFGLVTQLANILHIGNKRISFYFVRWFTGLPAVGVYGAGTQLTEGLRLIGQSISLVQFSEISNTNNKDYAVKITIKLMKFSVLLTIFAVIVLLIIPTDIYLLIFTAEFTDLKYVIIALSPGVIALSSNTIFSHYFAGLGRPVISLWANGIGFLITITLAILLIPTFGYIGAAATVSTSYITSVIYQYFVFKKETGIKLSQWLPEKNDLNDFKRIIKGLIKKE
ncbi:MAG: polysaccharide biosynthesis C-terminal domain-containing protein [Bacteroidetes bacterium]|nr:polysaccharide biosynthesis C-terminal domain-containing protein [Bacteroidota bacterium]